MIKNTISLNTLLVILLILQSCDLDLPISDPAVNESLSYGADTNPTGDAIGGGGCYSKRVTEGDYYVDNAQDLLAALESAQPGQVVMVSKGASIDLTGIHEIIIPGGVTLAGNRGNCDLDNNEGPLLFTNRMNEQGVLFRMRENGSRVTGLRFRGPDPDNPDIDYDVEPQSWTSCFMTNSKGIEIDNCEISNFHRAGVSINYNSSNIHIHHNYIHDIHAYPVVVAHASELPVTIEANKIEWVWVNIGGTGFPGIGYEARYNYFIRKPAPDSWQPYSGGHAMDMHSYQVVVEERNHYIAGDLIEVHHNTFIDEAEADPSVARSLDANIRGVPRILADFYNNCFLNSKPEQAVAHYGGNVWVHNNLYGEDSTLINIAYESTPQILFNNPPPPAEEIPSLIGNSLIFDIEIHVLDYVQLDSVIIELDGNLIFARGEAPAPGTLSIDPCKLDQNLPYHELSVTAIDNRNVKGHHLTVFRANCK